MTSEGVLSGPLMGEGAVGVKEVGGEGWVDADLVHESFPISR